VTGVPRRGARPLSPFLVALPELAGLDFQHLAQNVQRAEIDALGVAVCFHESNSGGDREGALARLHQRIGIPHPSLAHEVRQSKSHVEHTTNVPTDAVSRNSEIMLALPCTRY
jgi:hypothetical protein